MRHVTKALVVDEPWIDLILAGEKTWEMRSTSPSHRGWFGLIRKGSGAVVGVARLIDVGPRLSPDEMIETFDQHRIPADMIRSGAVAKWTVPWVLADVRPLAPPVPYQHKSGAVTWVELDPEVTAAIAQRLGFTVVPQAEAVAPLVREPAPRSPPPVTRIEPMPAAPRSKAASGMWGEVEVTLGNLKNNHFYMRSFIDRFPGDLIGGSNKASAAPRSALVDWGGPAPIETDIDGEKQFFRARGWIKAFFADNNAAPGDRVRVEETAPYRYRVILLKTDVAE